MRLILGTIAATACLALLIIEYGIGFGGTLIIAMVNLCAILLSVIFLGIALLRKSRLLLKWVGMLFFVLVVGNYLGFTVVIKRVEQVTNTANVIIAALTSYHDENGSYPDTLDHLVLERLKRIPRAKVSIFTERDFRYFITEGGNAYTLSFEIPVYSYRQYDSKRKDWRRID